METSILVTIAIFLLVQGGCLVWILSDLTTRTKLNYENLKSISDFLAGLEARFVTEKEFGPIMGSLKDRIDAAHRRLDGIDAHVRAQ